MRFSYPIPGVLRLLHKRSTFGRQIHINSRRTKNEESTTEINLLQNDEANDDEHSKRISRIVREISEGFKGPLSHGIDAAIKSVIETNLSDLKSKGWSFPLPANKFIFENSTSIEVDSIKRAFFEEKNKTYNAVKGDRKEINRNEAPMALYINFLRHLYPHNNEKVNIHELIQAYTSLPQPHPLFIGYHDFEELLSVFMKADPSQRNIIIKFMLSLADDMKKCGLRLSLAEKNNIMHLQLRDEIEKYSIELYNNLRDMLDLSDISSYNILLNYAVIKGDEDIVNQILYDLNERDIEFDRFTSNLLMKFYSKIGDVDQFLSSVEDFIKKFTIDVVTYNTMIAGFVDIRRVHIGEILLQILVHIDKSGSSASSNDLESKKSHNQKSKLLDIVNKNVTSPNCLRYTFHPTENTFYYLVKEYSRADYPFDKIRHLLDIMNKDMVPISQKTLSTVYAAFGFNSHESWNLKNLNYLTSNLLASVERNECLISFKLCSSVIDAYIRFGNNADYEKEKIALYALVNSPGRLSREEREFKKGNALFNILKDTFNLASNAYIERSTFNRNDLWKDQEIV